MGGGIKFSAYCSRNLIGNGDLIYVTILVHILKAKRIGYTNVLDMTYSRKRRIKKECRASF